MNTACPLENLQSLCLQIKSVSFHNVEYEHSALYIYIIFIVPEVLVLVHIGF